MAEDKKVQFSAVDSGISSFMKKVQQDAKSMYESLAKESKNQTNSQKEQFRFIRDTINALKEQLRLEQQITKEKYRRAKSSYERAIDPTTEAFFKAKMDEQAGRLAELGAQGRVLKGAQQINTDRRSDQAPGRFSMFNSLIAADLFRDLIGVIRQVPQAQTGLDLLTPFSGFTGGVAGGALGAGIDVIPLLETNLAPAMANIGKEIGGFVGNSLTRHLQTKDTFERSYYKFMATTGVSGGVPNLGAIGFDNPAVAASMLQMSQAAGTGIGAFRNASVGMGLQRGYGIDEGTIIGALRSERLGGGSGRANMQKILGMAIAEGLDRARFNDVIKDQTELIKRFAQFQTNVDISGVNRNLFEYHRMGGKFSIGDPRSRSLRETIDSSLKEPGTPFQQAASYAVLRELGFDNIWDIEGAREQGDAIPGYRQAMVDFYKRQPWSEQQKKLAIKRFFGNIPNQDVETIYRAKAMTDEEYSGISRKILGDKTIMSEAEKYTSNLTRQQAEITNAFQQSFISGIDTIRVHFEKELKLAAGEVAKELKEAAKSMPSSVDDFTGGFFTKARLWWMMPSWSNKPKPRGASGGW